MPMILSKWLVCGLIVAKISYTTHSRDVFCICELLFHQINYTMSLRQAKEMLLPLKLYPLVSFSENLVIYTWFLLILQDVCFIFVLPIFFSFNNFKEGSSGEIPLVYVWLGCECSSINQQKSVCLSTSLLPLFSTILTTNIASTA